jgi:hypothetical protein
VNAALRVFLSAPNDREVDLCKRAVSLRFTSAKQTYDRALLWATAIDGDSGGFVVADVVENLRICLADKVQKVARSRGSYQDWWLIFIDLVTCGSLDPNDRASVQSVIEIPKPFTRLIFLDPRDCMRSWALQ